MSEPWTIVTSEVVTAERLREVIEKMEMLADQSPDWVTVGEIVGPVTVTADAVITEAVFEDGRLKLKWHGPGDTDTHNPPADDIIPDPLPCESGGTMGPLMLIPLGIILAACVAILIWMARR
jgi:hypothetical protein